MADEVVETVGTTETQDINDNLDIDDTEIDETTESTETEETEETTEQESTEFDPDTLEFEEAEEDFTFGDYNLSRFKDNLNLSDENVRRGMTELAVELKENNFTQAQIEWLMEKEISAVQNKNSVEPTKEQVMKELKETLTIQERKDYKAVGGYLKENLKGTELEKYYKEAMSNPAVFKIVHALYSKNLSGKPITTAKDAKEVKKPEKSFEQVTEEYLDFLSKSSLSKEDKKPHIEKILSSLSKTQRAEFKKMFSID